MQEIVMAEETIIMCGQHSVYGLVWGKTAVVMHGLLNILDQVVEASLISPWSHYFTRFYRAHVRFLLFFRLRLSLHRLRHGLPQSEDLHAGRFVHFLELARHCRASDDKDKVFGIIGLAQAFGDTVPITVDYMHSTRELYVFVAMALYTRSKTLDFLGYLKCKNSVNFSRNFDLPSWVPDWTLRSTTSFGRIVQMQCMKSWSSKDQNHFQIGEVINFTRGSVSDCSFEPLGGKMVVNGFRFDTVKRAGRRGSTISIKTWDTV